MLNELSIRLRKMTEDRPAVFGWAIAAMILLGVADVVADMLMPTGFVWNCVRTVLALVTAVPMFMSGYFIGMKIHDASVASAEEDGVDYLEYRLRKSPNARYRRAFIAICIIALLGILTYNTVIYTVSAAAVVSMVMAVMLYCRLTPDEKILAEYGSPDPRDIIEEAEEEDQRLTREANKELHREKVEARKRRLRHENDEDDGDEEETDDEDEEEDENDEKPSSKRHRNSSPLRP